MIKPKLNEKGLIALGMHYYKEEICLRNVLMI